MGHNKKKSPRRGSLQYWPRVRAKRSYPIIKNWAKKDQAVPLGFSGYKVGMTHIIVVDNKPKSPTKGEEVRVPVTILEVPSIKVAGVRLYSKDFYGLKSLGEVWSDKLDKELARRIKIPKAKITLDKLKELLPKTADVRLITYTQPIQTGFGKKKPDIFETHIGGDVNAQFEYAASILGKEIKLEDVFKEGELLDVHSITTGKGFQGVVKKFGVKLQRHKAEKGRRKIATMGSFTPKWTPWWICQPGKFGFHTRTEYNKQLMKISNVSEQNVNPTSGFSKYGIVKGNYALIAGSVPGPKKRLIRLTHAIRSPIKSVVQAQEVVNISTTSQQR